MQPKLPARSQPTANQFTCPRRAKADSSPISTFSMTRCSPAPSLATSPRLRIRRVQSPIAPIWTSLRRWHAASVSLCSPTNAIARSTASMRLPACWRLPDPISPTSWYSTHFPNVRTFRVCAWDLLQATGASSVHILNCAMWRHRKCRRRRNTSRLPLTVMRRMCRRIARFTPPSSILPIRSSGIATDISVRTADSFFGWTFRSRAAVRP